MTAMLRAAGLLIGSTLLLTSGGCSGGRDLGPTGTVKGRLTMDSKPLSPGHAVSFMDMRKGSLAFGKTDAKGDFEVGSWNNGNMPLGTYRVFIAPPPLEAPKKEMTAEERFDHPEMEVNWKMEFPKKYRDPSTSGLEYEVKTGDNAFDIDLKSSKTAPPKP